MFIAQYKSYDCTIRALNILFKKKLLYTFNMFNTSNKNFYSLPKHEKYNFIRKEKKQLKSWENIVYLFLKKS